MSQSSTLFAKRVHEAMRRIEHSYMRRKDGSRGGGAHSNVIQFAIEAEATGPSLIWDVPDITYLSTGDDEGAFLINRTGLYAVTFVHSRTLTSVGTVEIRVDAVVDNTVNDAKTRARDKPLSSTALNGTLHWCGHVAAGQHIWGLSGTNVAGGEDEVQFSIARVG